MCEVGGLLFHEGLADFLGACEDLQRGAVLALRLADAPEVFQREGKVALVCEVGGLLFHEGLADLLGACEDLQRGAELALRLADAPEVFQRGGKVALVCEVGGLLFHEGLQQRHGLGGNGEAGGEVALGLEIECKSVECLGKICLRVVRVIRGMGGASFGHGVMRLDEGLGQAPFGPPHFRQDAAEAAADEGRAGGEIRRVQDGHHVRSGGAQLGQDVQGEVLNRAGPDEIGLDQTQGQFRTGGGGAALPLPQAAHILHEAVNAEDALRSFGPLGQAEVIDRQQQAAGVLLHLGAHALGQQEEGFRFPRPGDQPLGDGVGREPAEGIEHGGAGRRKLNVRGLPGHGHGARVAGTFRVEVRVIEQFGAVGFPIGQVVGEGERATPDGMGGLGEGEGEAVEFIRDENSLGAVGVRPGWVGEAFVRCGVEEVFNGVFGLEHVEMQVGDVVGPVAQPPGENDPTIVQAAEQGLGLGKGGFVVHIVNEQEPAAMRGLVQPVERGLKAGFAVEGRCLRQVQSAGQLGEAVFQILRGGCGDEQQRGMLVGVSVGVFGGEAGLAQPPHAP